MRRSKNKKSRRSGSIRQHARLNPEERLCLMLAREEANARLDEGDPEGAVTVLFHAYQELPKHDAILTSALGILVENNFHPNDIRACIREIRTIRELRPKEKMWLGLAEFRLGNWQEALLLLEKASTYPENILESWGVSSAEIETLLNICTVRTRTTATSRAPRAKRIKTTKPAEREKKKPPVPQVDAARPVSVKPPSAGGISDPPPPAARIASYKPEISVVSGSSAGLFSALAKRADIGTGHYFLALRAGDLARAETFEDLVCIDGLRDVAQLAYQTETVRKVLRSFRGRVLLADEVGLGKTIEAGMVLREYMLRKMVKTALVLVPPALVSQWCDELSAKMGLHPVAAEGALLKRDPEAFWRSNPLVVASLALARHPRHAPIISRIPYDMVIADEAHHVKKANTAGWKLVNGLRSRFLLLLSATPVENDLMDLYNLVTLLKPGQLGTRTEFRRQFVRRGDPATAQNRERLRALIGEVMIRNTRALADIKLPPRHATTVLVQQHPSEQELYRRLTELVRRRYRESASHLALGLLLQEAGSSPGAVRKTLMKMAEAPGMDDGMRAEMHQIAKLSSYVPATAKADRLMELIRASREKVLVFSRFKATLADLASRLAAAGISYTLFSGDRTGEEKDAAVEAFRNGTDVMLCSEIGGEGRNLQFCSTMVNYDLPWNPMKIEQRIGRIHRIGQTRPVHVYNLCAADTAEHHILDVLDRRLNLFELVIGEVDLVLGQLKTEDEFEDRILGIYGNSRDEDDVAAAFDKLGEELLAARQRYEKIRTLDAEIFVNDYEV